MLTLHLSRIRVPIPKYAEWNGRSFVVSELSNLSSDVIHFIFDLFFLSQTLNIPT